MPLTAKIRRRDLSSLALRARRIGASDLLARRPGDSDLALATLSGSPTRGVRSSSLTGCVTDLFSCGIAVIVFSAMSIPVRGASDVMYWTVMLTYLMQPRSILCHPDRWARPKKIANPASTALWEVHGIRNLVRARGIRLDNASIVAIQLSCSGL